MTDIGGRCPAIPGFCVEAWQCRNCGYTVKLSEAPAVCAKLRAILA